MQAYLKDIEGLVSDHCSMARVKIKQVIIFLLVEGLAFSLQKCNVCEMQYVKKNKTRSDYISNCFCTAKQGSLTPGKMHPSFHYFSYLGYRLLLKFCPSLWIIVPHRKGYMVTKYMGTGHSQSYIWLGHLLTYFSLSFLICIENSNSLP